MISLYFLMWLLYTSQYGYIPLLSILSCPSLSDLLATVGNLSIVTESLVLNLLIKLGHIPSV